MRNVEFYRPLVEWVEYNGDRYYLTPAYDNVLSMFADVKGVSPEDQAEIMLYYLLEDHVPTDTGLLLAVNDALFENKKTKGGKVFDFIQDGALIYAAFRQAYGIDLVEEQGKLHWWKFQALLGGLPSDTKFSEVVKIRTMKLPKPTKYNQDQISELLRLKSEFKLEISQEEREANLQEGFRKMAQALMAMAKEENG